VRLLQDAVTRARSVLGRVGIVLQLAIVVELQGNGVPAGEVAAGAASVNSRPRSTRPRAAPTRTPRRQTERQTPSATSVDRLRGTKNGWYGASPSTPTNAEGQASEASTARTAAGARLNRIPLSSSEPCRISSTSRG
jgi:hypothetical protein